MTPLHLRIALHYYVYSAHSYGAYEPEHANSRAVRQYKEDLIAKGLLADAQYDPTYADLKPTAALQVYIDALCRVPLPVQMWVIPK